MQRVSRRDVLQAAAASGVCLLAGGASAQTRVVMNDASKLNPTPTFRHWTPKSQPDLIETLRRELAEAAAAGRPVVIGAARHSMGGQSLARHGLAITFDAGRIEPDLKAETCRVPAGARWSDVIRALDAIGYGPAVMQTNADFGVASTFSVNAHGWPVPRGPFGSTVRSLRLMLASGDVVECSREKNPELFSLAMGGYGLVGIILDLEIEMTKNVLLTGKLEAVAPSDFGSRFVDAILGDKGVRMAYGRLSVARNAFFREGLLATWRPAPNQPEKLPPAASATSLGWLSRRIYRAQIGSEAGKKARWLAETSLGPKLIATPVTRNSLMNEPVANLGGSEGGRTDILHEYFLAPGRLTDFIGLCREIIPPARAEFLNVTFRYVAADETSTLAYAPQARIAAVMSFSQDISPEGEVDMIKMTERLIDAAISLGGAFYLPYRLHARPDQLAAAYPKAAQFAARKRAYDPRLLFRHALWDAYFRDL